VEVAVVVRLLFILLVAVVREVLELAQTQVL
jgi:hypothetical protein